MITSQSKLHRNTLWNIFSTIPGALDLPRALYLVLLLSLLLNITGIWWGLLPGSTWDWGADTISPNNVFRAASQGFSNGWHTRYPPLHYQLLTVLYAPFLFLHALGIINVQSHPLYTILFYQGRMLTLLIATVVVILVYRISLELKINPKGAILASAITSLNPIFVYYSKTTNLDVPYTMWFLASMLYAIRAIKSHKLSDFILASIFATLAICTKDQAYAFYVLLVPVVFYAHWSRLRRHTPGYILPGLKTAKAFSVPIIIAAAIFVTIYALPFNFEGFIAHVKLIVGPSSTDYRVYENSLSGHLNMLLQSLRHLIFTQGWPFFIITTFGIIQALLRAKTRPILLFPLVSIISYYLFFISIIGYNSDRFFLPICIIFSIYGGAWLESIAESQKLPKYLKIGTFIAALAYSFLYAASIDTLMIADSRYEAYKWIEEHIEPDATIYGIGRAYYLPPLDSYQTKLLSCNPSRSELTQTDPDFIITSSIFGKEIFKNGSEGFLFFTELHDGQFNYENVFKCQGEPLFNLLTREGIFTNLDKLNPEIQVFRRINILN